ncbi:hypothetical protein TOPH_01925 [Tolypocladium ophioglossoides CBS 100239]|uniref:Uncharacterized protein n=1 Tax=Tolypocladium ophioglossoides (strain CBS 100239) TaxID=1163406 RepID=A0A0L0NI13_TOLOC|nr:hypothetical protein TOPH_01925 [Tolypocladium ophioglossoides CBS 100239]
MDVKHGPIASYISGVCSVTRCSGRPLLRITLDLLSVSTIAVSLSAHLFKRIFISRLRATRTVPLCVNRTAAVNGTGSRVTAPRQYQALFTAALRPRNEYPPRRTTKEPKEDSFHITEAEAKKRIHLAVYTSDHAWKSKHRKFSQLPKTPATTLADILSGTFTFDEACLLVASGRPELKARQSDRTRRYRVLLRERFKGVAEDRATKLTMAYFGLPVAPLSAPEEAGGKTDVDMEQKGETKGERAKPSPWKKLADRRSVKQPPSDTHTAPPADQTALRLRGGGAASDAEQEASDDEDETSGSESGSESPGPSSNGDDEWALLHGFQGGVPFLVGDVDTFESAVRRLLALPPGAASPYVLVHFHARKGTLVEIEDDLGSGADGPALGYVAQHWELEDNGEEVLAHRDDCCALFVRTKGEETPSMWKPTEAQLRADVAQIKHTCDISMPQSRGPASSAYISFPKTTGPDGPHISLWDASQYVPYMQTAVDVLLGRPADGGLHHAVLQLAKASDKAVASFSRSYGVVPMRPQDIQAIHPQQQQQQQQQQQPEAVLLRQYPLSTPQVALVLPGFYPEPTAGIVSVVHAADLQPHTAGQLPNAILHMRRMVTQFLGDEAVGVPYVRLLAGDATLNPAHVDRRQVTAVVPMSDAVMQAGATPPVDVCKALARFMDTRPRFIVLYPQYGQGEARMHAGWPSDGPPEKRRRALPPLSSSADDFRALVAELSRAAGGRDGGGVLYEPKMHRVGIRALVASTDAQVEASTFFVGPRTTDDEWFTIRAQLTTRNAVVNVWPPAQWEWTRQIARSNVWGPRYGRAADGNVRPTQRHAAGRGALAAVPSSVPVGKSTAAAPEASPDHHDAAPEHDKHHRNDAPPRLPPSPHHRSSTAVSACPHAGCDFTFRGDEKAAFARHVRERHVASKCLWCEEPLHDWWTDEAKDTHLRTKHRDRLMQALGVRRATINQRDGSTTVSIALKRGQGPVPSVWATNRYSAPPIDVNRPGTEDGDWRASSDQKFCHLCGRDRRQFFSEGEQAYHDRHCRPGIYHGAQCTFCTECGDYRWGSDLDAARSGRCHGAATSCGHGTDPEAGRFCQRCGLDYNSLLRGGREVHESCCRGYGAQPGRFCPHCGVRFWEGHAQADWYYNTRHIEACEARDVAMKQPDMTIQEEDSQPRSQPRRVLSAPPGRIPGPKQPARKKQKPKPEHRQHPDEDDPSSVEDRARRRARKRRRPRPDDSDYEYNSDVDSADGLAPDFSDDSADDPNDAAAARRKKRRRMMELDPAYQYETDEDSADGLQPDVDDLHAAEDQQIDAEAEAEAQAQGLALDEEREREKAETAAAAIVMARGQGKGQGRKTHDAAHRHTSHVDSAEGLKPDVDGLNHTKRLRLDDPLSQPPKEASPDKALETPVKPPRPASPSATTGKKGQKPAKASPRKAPKPKPKPAPKRATASPRKPRQQKAAENAPPRRSARIGSKKP